MPLWEYSMHQLPLNLNELKAARASAEMVLKLDDLRAYWKKNDLYSKEAQEMDARIGLNSGSAKVGFMGTDALASYTMMGDTVNLAARLEAAGKDYGVNVLITDSVCDKDPRRNGYKVYGPSASKGKERTSQDT